MPQFLHAGTLADSGSAARQRPYTKPKPHPLMRIRNSIVFLAAAALAAAPAGAQQALPFAQAELDAQVQRALREFQVPGAAIAIVKDGRVVMERGFGVRRLGEAAPVDEHTLFQIASNSKAFTSAALAMLVDEGKLGWDDRVIDHLPWFRLSDPYATREFTIRDLLTHRSGMGLGAGDLLWYRSTYSPREVMERIRVVPLVTSFRSAYAYDNVLYGVAGEVVAAVSGQRWEDFVRDRMFAPLGMTESVTLASRTPAGGNVAVPHSRFQGALRVVRADTMDNNAAAAAIVASVHDLARWMIAQLDSGRIAGSERRLWSAARTREMWTGVTPIPIGGGAPQLAAYTPNFHLYGLGWFLRDYRGMKVATHTGGAAGMTSRTVLVPELKLGIVMLTNGESPAMTAVPWWIMDRYLGAPATDWVGGFAAAARAGEENAAQVEARATAGRTANTRPALPLERYAQAYDDPMYGRATLAMEGRGLVLRFAKSPAFVADLEHWHFDTFVARWRDRTIPDAYVTFRLTPQGGIGGFEMAAVSPLADFSFDYQDLHFVPAPAAR